MRLLLLLALLLPFAARPAGAQAGTPVTLGAAEYRRLNVFLSNFAEADLAPFAAGHLTDAHKIDFAALHIYWNRERDLGRTPEGCVIRPAAVNEVALRYFGARVQTPRSTEHMRYSGGVYHFGCGDGDPRSSAHAANVRRLPSGDLTATVDVYMLQELFPDRNGDAYAKMPEQMRRISQNATLQNASASADFTVQRQARFREVREGGRARYILLEWR